MRRHALPEPEWRRGQLLRVLGCGAIAAVVAVPLIWALLVVVLALDEVMR